MRLIVSYSTGDAVPFEYESAERLLLDIGLLVDIVLENQRNSVYEDSPIIRAGESELEITDFISGDKYWPPSVISVDQWFEESGLS